MSDLEDAFLYSGNRILNTSSTNTLSIDNISLEFFNFDRYIPNEFRFYLSNKYCSYREMLFSRDKYGNLLRTLLEAGFIYSFNWEIILSKILIKEGDTLEEIEKKNNLRNNFLKFSLLCEKSNVFNAEGKNICGNFIVPWEDYYNIIEIPQSVFPKPKPPIFKVQNGNTLPISFEKMSAIFSIGSISRELAINANETYTPKSIIPTFFNKIKPSNPCEIPNSFFIFVPFPEYVNTALDLLDVIYSVSENILQAKNPGIPVEFKEYFTYEIAQYYYSYYNPIIITRNKILSMS
jgi:hypothetical protein